MDKKEKTIVGLVLQGMLLGSVISGSAMYGATEINENKNINQTYENRVMIEEKVMKMKLGALENANALPKDFDIAESVAQYIKEKDADFMKESKEQVKNDQKSAVKLGTFFGTLAGAASGVETFLKRRRKEEMER